MCGEARIPTLTVAAVIFWDMWFTKNGGVVLK